MVKEKKQRFDKRKGQRRRRNVLRRRSISDKREVFGREKQFTVSVEREKKSLEMNNTIEWAKHKQKQQFTAGTETGRAAGEKFQPLMRWKMAT